MGLIADADLDIAFFPLNNVFQFINWISRKGAFFFFIGVERPVLLQIILLAAFNVIYNCINIGYRNQFFANCCAKFVFNARFNNKIDGFFDVIEYFIASINPRI